MGSYSYFPALVFLVAFFMAGPASGMDYTAIDLTPGGMSVVTGRGISMDGLQQVGYNLFPDGQTEHALLWTGSAAGVVDLHPTNPAYFSSMAYGANGSQQVGNGSLASSDMGQLGYTTHALMWFGTAQSCIDLNPSGFTWSDAVATNGSQQCGGGLQPNEYGASGSHAILWNGSAQNYVDLNPAGFRESGADGMDATRQVGSGFAEGMSGYHALMWIGTAQSYVDLAPDWLTDSEAWAVCGNDQVGNGYDINTMGDNPHALLWHGSAQSAIDLNPKGFDSSYAIATNGIIQVGGGKILSVFPPVSHALVWAGSADSCIDLSQFLPAGYQDSDAYSVDQYGDIFGTADDGTNVHAVMWVPTPEPSTLLLMIGGLAGAFSHRRS